MTRTLITFCTPEYARQAERLRASACPYFDVVKVITPKDLSVEWRKRNAHLLTFRRGFSFWAWKSEIIIRELERMGSEDELAYADSSVVFERDPSLLFEWASRHDGIGIVHQKRERHKNSTWTRRDCFIEMGCDEPRIWDSDNLATTFSFWKRTDKSLAFVREWQRWCENYVAVSDENSAAPNLPGWRDHRHDQSIMSILAARDGLATACDCSQFGDGYRCPECNYPRILRVDRTVKASWLRRPTMSSIVEVSTLATCPLRCSYCPQDALGEAYKGPALLTVEMFNRCLDNLVPGDAIHFSGFTEPCINPEIVTLMEMALGRGHRVKVYTTGRGLNVTKAELIAAMELDLLMLHLPDAFGHLGHAVGNVSVLNALSKHPNAKVMCMGNEPHADVAHLWDALSRQHGAMIDRAGNLGDTVQVQHQKHKGAIKCGAAPQLDHPVLLPNGDLVLCCCDYSLSQIVGNLATTPLSEILGGAAIQKVMDLQRNGGDVICRSCSFAVPA